MGSRWKRVLVTLTGAAMATFFVGGRCGGNPKEVGADNSAFGVLQEEFDGPAGQAPDPTIWKAEVGGKGWGNNQLEFDTDRVENASLDGQGNLAIVARQESYQGNQYTSARLVTKTLYKQQYGRFAARIKLPSGAGMWPAFWLLGANIDAVSWPGCGEIDIMELKGQEPSTIHGSAHGPGYSGGAALTGAFTLPNGARFDQDFHVFSVDWYPDHLTYSVDDVAYETKTVAELGSKKWVFDHPFFIILNLAVGGDYVGPPDGNTQFPQTMLVDWVRVTSPP
jgi:beta-glucanase (GH16 family)